MRTEYVKNSEELNHEINEYIRSGYKCYTGDGVKSAEVIKRHKVSAGWSIFWIFFGALLGFFIYLIYCGAHKPIDQVNIVVSETTTPQTNSTGVIYCPNCGQPHEKVKGRYCPFCGADCGDIA